jgi:hypothetical protein
MPHATCDWATRGQVGEPRIKKFIIVEASCLYSVLRAPYSISTSISQRRKPHSKMKGSAVRFKAMTTHQGAGKEHHMMGASAQSCVG